MSGVPPKTGKNLDDLQDNNRAQIIRYLAMHEECSRVELAKATGLRQASITKIVRSLMRNRVVFETGFTEGLKGRRSIGLALNYEKYRVIGVKLSWERLSFSVFDLKARTYGEPVAFALGHLSLATADTVVRLVVETVRTLLAAHDNVIAVGIAVPGPFHRGTGSILLPHDGENEKAYFPILGKIREQIPLPVIMDHDANAGALGYWWFRTNCDTRIALLFLLASEGIGGGVVSKGQIFTGQRGHSAELGHIIVETDGRLCTCGGHGCLDAYTSSLSLEKRARDLLPGEPGSQLAAFPAVTADRIFAAMRNGDAFAARLVREAGTYLGLGFSTLIPIFDPDLIVVSDLMAAGGEILLEGINESLDRTLSPFYPKPRIVLADVGDDLVLLGAATIAIDRAFSNPTEFLVAGAAARAE